MQSTSLLESPSSHPAADVQGSRHLSDEVLQSAEEAVLVEIAAGDDGSLPMTATSPENSPGLHVTAPYRTRSSFKTTVRQYVAASPCQSALVAAAVGALAVVLLRSSLRQRAGSHSWTRLR